MGKCIRGISFAALISAGLNHGDPVLVNAFWEQNRKRRIHGTRRISSSSSIFAHQLNLGSTREHTFFRQYNVALTVSSGGSSSNLPSSKENEVGPGSSSQDSGVGISTENTKEDVTSEGKEDDIDTDQFLSEFKEEMKQMRLELDRELEELKKSSRKAVEEEMGKEKLINEATTDYTTPSENNVAEDEARNSKDEELSPCVDPTSDRDPIKPEGGANIEESVPLTQSGEEAVSRITETNNTAPNAEMENATMDTELANGLEMCETETEDDAGNESKERTSSYPEVSHSESEEIATAFLNEEAEHKVEVALSELESSTEVESPHTVEKEENKEKNENEENGNDSNDNIMDFDEAYDKEEAKLFDEADSSGNEDSLASSLKAQETDLTTNKEALSMTLKTAQPLSSTKTRPLRRVLLTSFVAIASVLVTLLLRELSKRVVSHAFPLESQSEKAKQLVTLISGILSYIIASAIVSLSRHVRQSKSRSKTS